MQLHWRSHELSHQPAFAGLKILEAVVIVPREPSTMAAERRMVDAWVAAHLPGPTVDEQRTDRLAAETLIIRKAIGRETQSLPPPWKDDAEPPILR